MKSKSGTVFDITPYMVEDGPGIRTGVFVKGCPLKCRWCSNIYGISAKKQLAYLFSRCSGCLACVKVCTQQANSILAETGKAVVDFSRCTACGECIPVCPSEARIIVGREYSSDEIVDIIEADRMFYRRGEGGITLSGGEILMQPEFVIDVLKKCHEAMINTAVETCAFGKWEDLREIIHNADTVFMDCKCMDKERHRELTGVDNTLILSNIRRAAELCRLQKKCFIVRMPLIPGLNDDEENITATAAFVKSLPGSPELNILPYHNYGENKYAFIGKKYPLKGLRPPDNEELSRIRNILDRQGIWYSIGGFNIQSYNS